MDNEFNKPELKWYIDPNLIQIFFEGLHHARLYSYQQIYQMSFQCYEHTWNILRVELIRRSKENEQITIIDEINEIILNCKEYSKMPMTRNRRLKEKKIMEHNQKLVDEIAKLDQKICEGMMIAGLWFKDKPQDKFSSPGELVKRMFN